MPIDSDQVEAAELSDKWGLSQEASFQFVTFINTIAAFAPLDKGGRMNIGNGDPIEIAEDLLVSFKECLRKIKSEVGTENPAYEIGVTHGFAVIMKILREYWEGTEKSVGDAEGIRPILVSLEAYELPLMDQLMIKGFQDELPISKVSLVFGILVIIIACYYLIRWLF